MGRGTRIIGLFAFLAATAIAAPLALAGPEDDARIEATSFNLVFNNAGEAEADCPPGKTAVGGGLGTVTPAINSAINVSGPVDRTEITAETRTGDRPAGWSASAYSGSGSEQEFRSYAICSASAEARLRVASFSVPPSRTEAKTVSCPHGEAALGGGLGLSTNPVSGVYEVSSGPLAKSGGTRGAGDGDVPRKWQVAAYNGFGVKRTFKALVVCSSQTKPRIAAQTTDIAPNTDVELTAACPAGKRALGGGLSPVGHLTSDLQMVANGPQDSTFTTSGTKSGDVPVAWDGEIYSRASSTKRFKTLAICA